MVWYLKLGGEGGRGEEERGISLFAIKDRWHRKSFFFQTKNFCFFFRVSERMVVVLNNVRFVWWVHILVFTYNSSCHPWMLVFSRFFGICSPIAMLYVFLPIRRFKCVALTSGTGTGIVVKYFRDLQKKKLEG